MKFKTIVITKKKLLIILVILILGGTVPFIIKFIPPKATAVFNESVSYEDILDEALPDNTEHKISISDIISKIVGFDLDKPETILSQYSVVFTENDDNLSETVSESALPTENSNEQGIAEAENNVTLPTKEQIKSASNMKINNATNYNVNLEAMCGDELGFSVDSDAPQVLVMHTHTTECYDGDEMNGETERNTDDNVNVVAVGNEICSVLESYGIKTVHDITYHDYPSYQGSYTRALKTIEKQLENNPSIKIVLDVHRDAFVYSDGSKLSVRCNQNGISTAQVMIVAGTDSMGLQHDNWRENLKFAAKIQNAAEIMYPGLMRPVNLRTERFNEHATLGSLILEVGSNGNTLDEAKEGGRDVARAIAAVLKSK